MMQSARKTQPEAAHRAAPRRPAAPPPNLAAPQPPAACRKAAPGEGVFLEPCEINL